MAKIENRNKQRDKRSNTKKMKSLSEKFSLFPLQKRKIKEKEDRGGREK
jgi:hypothetical protein